MTQPAPSFSLIRARVQAVRRKMPAARVIGIHSTGRYAGERLCNDGVETYRIEQCDSPLAARAVLIDDEPGVTVTVLVTPLEDPEIGDDLRVRLAKGRLFRIDSWQIVKELFQAHTVDPRLRLHPWIAETLLQLVDTAAAVPAPGGYLDAEVVWPLLLNRLIGLAGERPDLAMVLRWSAGAENVQRFRRLAEEPRRAIEKWLEAQLGPVVLAVLRCAMTVDGPDALAVGLVAGVVHHPDSAGRLDRAAGRLERFLGGSTPESPLLERWHTAATEAIRVVNDDPRLQGQVLHRAGEILGEVQAEDFAHLSDVLTQGFDQRLSRLGILLGQASQDGMDRGAALREARDAIRRHDQARREPRRLERVEMALRLVAWLRVDAKRAQPRSLAEAARSYVDEGSFVDWARSVLRAGDPVRGLSEGYARLLRQVREQRELQNRQFAELLRDQTAAGGMLSDPIPVERIIDEVVAPLAAQAPVLVILLDGMSAAIAAELMADLARLDWLSLGPEGRAVRPGLAAIPCVTEASRASLFSGRLCVGSGTDEAGAFAAHPGLRAPCRSGHPPILFHKIALQEEADASLAAAVREAIASSQKRVVGVVVNAVDDHLLKGEQLDLRWTRDDIKVLPSLVYEARSARRVVVLLSDHGHLLDHQSEMRPGDGGERWRPGSGQPADGELLVQGPRVLLAEGHRLIAPWTEQIRYAGRKNGYHGGLTPQEMLIPIKVLASADLRVPGWSELPDPTPDWWEAAPGAVTQVAEQGTQPTKKRAELLWDIAEEEGAAASERPADKDSRAPAPATWVAALLGSSLFAGQKRLGGRAVPADDIFARFLVTLDAAGGKMTATAVARRLELPLFRLRGLLAVVQRVLNVEGYAVLSRDEASDTIELDRGLLLRQFELPAGDVP